MNKYDAIIEMAPDAGAAPQAKLLDRQKRLGELLGGRVWSKKLTINEWVFCSLDPRDLYKDPETRQERYEWTEDTNFPGLKLGRLKPEFGGRIFNPESSSNSGDKPGPSENPNTSSASSVPYSLPAVSTSKPSFGPKGNTEIS